MSWELRLGATYLGEGVCRFDVWAPLAQRIELHLVEPVERLVPMEQAERGYHTAVAHQVEAGSLYYFRIQGGSDRPDPASRLQPRGVHGPSQVVSPDFGWDDASWRGLPIDCYVIYEAHVGTMTPEGTLDAIACRLDELRDLGITAIELMPVAQFPGKRNWGYDGVYPFAVQQSYGGPEALKRLVDGCHRRGIAVVLDVVYNHIGPEGNYLGEFGPYFTTRYRTPWGPAMNFDGPHSDEVRRFFVDNALYWITEFHVDALRLDALHAILDTSPFPFVEELGVRVHEEVNGLGRSVYLIGESASNDARLVRSRERGGYGLDGHWNEDFHHSLHAVLTGERFGYYQDFGELRHLATAHRDGFVYSGQYSSYCRRRHGSSSRDIPASRFVVFAQNHDQVGNRMLGERLSHLVSFEEAKMAAGIVLLSPFIPLLFMGEEYGEVAPFQYFVSHSDPDLVEAVRRGRQEEFSAFEWQGEPPDPQDEATFQRAKLNWQLRYEGQHAVLLDFHRELIRLRRDLPALAHLSKDDLEIAFDEENEVMTVRRWQGEDVAVIVYHFGNERKTVSLALPCGRWHRELDSAEERWWGPGSTVPREWDSQGEVTLVIDPKRLILMSQAKEA